MLPVPYNSLNLSAAGGRYQNLLARGISKPGKIPVYVLKRITSSANSGLRFSTSPDTKYRHFVGHLS